jgi:hypothetical protein
MSGSASPAPNAAICGAEVSRPRANPCLSSSTPEAMRLANSGEPMPDPSPFSTISATIAPALPATTIPSELAAVSRAATASATRMPMRSEIRPASGEATAAVANDTPAARPSSASPKGKSPRIPIARLPTRYCGRHEASSSPVVHSVSACSPRRRGAA